MVGELKRRSKGWDLYRGLREGAGTEEGPQPYKENKGWSMQIRGWNITKHGREPHCGNWGPIGKQGKAQENLRESLREK